MKYFDFDALEHKAELFEIFMLVIAAYVIIFGVSWIYNKLQ